jgi:hypothetical protein
VVLNDSSVVLQAVCRLESSLSDSDSPSQPELSRSVGYEVEILPTNIPWLGLWVLDLGVMLSMRSVDCCAVMAVCSEAPVRLAVWRTVGRNAVPDIRLLPI